MSFSTYALKAALSILYSAFQGELNVLVISMRRKYAPSRCTKSLSTVITDLGALLLCTRDGSSFFKNVDAERLGKLQSYPIDSNEIDEEILYS